MLDTRKKFSKLKVNAHDANPNQNSSLTSHISPPLPAPAFARPGKIFKFWKLLPMWNPPKFKLLLLVPLSTAPRQTYSLVQIHPYSDRSCPISILAPLMCLLNILAILSALGPKKSLYMLMMNPLEPSNPRMPQCWHQIISLLLVNSLYLIKFQLAIPLLGRISIPALPTRHLKILLFILAFIQRTR